LLKPQRLPNISTGNSRFTNFNITRDNSHIIYNFPSGIWLALDGIYFAGGRTTVNGVRGDNEQTNTRVGLTLALPVDRNNSVKFSAGTNTTTRTGSEFSAVAVAWQYRWGAGY
jgi:hypothetical protein